jgi:hypothetical protein
VTNRTATLSYRALAAFFLPLAVAQVLQALRNPLLDAGMSRAPDPQTSLAAFAVVASVVQILSASGTAISSAYFVLVRGQQSYRVIRRYVIVYTSVITAFAVLIALPNIGDAFFQHVMGTPEYLVPDVMTMMRISLPVPIFNLIRQFYLAQLAHRKHSNLVWIGPAIGEAVLVVLALGLIPLLNISGGISGAFVWMTVAVLEGFLVFGLVQRVNKHAPYPADPPDDIPLDYRYVTSFLVPLVLTQVALVSGHPLINAGLLRLPNPEPTVAAFRVAFSLSMLPMTALVALRQVVLVLGREPEGQRKARTFAFTIGLALTTLMIVVAFTPLNEIVVRRLIGAPQSITSDTIVTMQIMAAFPIFMSVRQFYQSLTMNQRKTRLVALTAAIRLLAMVSILFVFTPILGWTGAGVGAVARIGAMGTEAIMAYLVGRKFFGLYPVTRSMPTSSSESSDPISLEQSN